MAYVMSVIYTDYCDYRAKKEKKDYIVRMSIKLYDVRKIGKPLLWWLAK